MLGPVRTDWKVPYYPGTSMGSLQGSRSQWDQYGHPEGSQTPWWDQNGQTEGLRSWDQHSPDWRVPHHPGIGMASLEDPRSQWHQYSQPGGAQITVGPVRPDWRLLHHAGTSMTTWGVPGCDGTSTASLEGHRLCWDQCSLHQGSQSMLGPVWPAWRVPIIAGISMASMDHPGTQFLIPVPRPRNPLSPPPSWWGGVTPPMGLTIKPSLCCHRHQ